MTHREPTPECDCQICSNTFQIRFPSGNKRHNRSLNHSDKLQEERHLKQANEMKNVDDEGAEASDDGAILDAKLTCSHCSEKVKNLPELAQHEMDHGEHSSKQFFSNNFRQTVSIKIAEIDQLLPPYGCPVCSKSFETLYQLTMHDMTHREPSAVDCQNM